MPRGPGRLRGAIYTCPMHPEIRQKGPGSCPICGMALEPAMVTRDEGPSAEYLDMRRRLWVGVALSVPLMVLAMGRHLLPGLFEALPGRALELDRGRAGLTRRPVGGRALLRAWLALDPEPQPQHVHADRGRHWRRLSLQPGRNLGAGHLPGVLPRARRGGGALFRGSRHHHHARARGPDPRDPCPRAYGRRHPRAARHGTGHRAASHRGRWRGGGAARQGGAGRPAAGPPRATRCRSTAR